MQPASEASEQLQLPDVKLENPSDSEETKGSDDSNLVSFFITCPSVYGPRGKPETLEIHLDKEQADRFQ